MISRYFKYGVYGVMVLFTILLILWLIRPLLFDRMADSMVSGSVPTVSTQELEQLPDALLLDAREKSEFDISHMDGATWVGFKDFKVNRVEDLPRDTPIVVYCSVGYRSEKVGEKLQKAGFTNVKNLYGGIFDWKNDGYPVINDQGVTDSVHVYSKEWGLWMQNGKKVYGP